MHPFKGGPFLQPVTHLTSSWWRLSAFASSRSRSRRWASRCRARLLASSARTRMHACVHCSKGPSPGQGTWMPMRPCTHLSASQGPNSDQLGHARLHLACMCSTELNSSRPHTFCHQAHAVRAWQGSSADGKQALQGADHNHCQHPKEQTASGGKREHTARGACTGAHPSPPATRSASAALRAISSSRPACSTSCCTSWPCAAAASSSAARLLAMAASSANGPWRSRCRRAARMCAASAAATSLAAVTSSSCRCSRCSAPRCCATTAAVVALVVLAGGHS